MTIELERELTATETLLSITPTAQEQLKAILDEEKNPAVSLRVFVQGSSAGMVLDDVVREDDLVMDFDGLRVLVDYQSAPHLTGAVIGFQNTLMERGFTIENANLPEASGGGCCGGNCGCGK